jgi:hypothetical protein
MRQLPAGGDSEPRARLPAKLRGTVSSRSDPRWPAQLPKSASTGAWSLVPTSARTLQEAALAATAVVART